MTPERTRGGRRIEIRPAPMNNPNDAAVSQPCHNENSRTTMVTTTFASDKGISTFHVSPINWSKRNRGSVHRNSIMTTTEQRTLDNNTSSLTTQAPAYAL